jgi:hypothetical protein
MLLPRSNIKEQLYEGTIEDPLILILYHIVSNLTDTVLLKEPDAAEFF